MCGAAPCDAFGDIQRIAQMFFPHLEGDGNQGFFQDAARSAFSGAASFLAETPGAQLTLGEVFRLLCRADGPSFIISMLNAARRAGEPYTEACVNALEDYLKGSVDLVNSIRKTVTAALGLWNNPRVDAATEASDFDLRRLRYERHAIYVGTSPETIEMLRPLLSLFFQQVIDLNVRVLPEHDPAMAHHLLLLLDEFPLLGCMPMLASAFAFVAGYWIKLLVIMQSKSQLRGTYGRDLAQTILDNCGLEVIFGTKDHEIARELSERIGANTVDARSVSAPIAGMPLHGSQHVSQQRRPFLLPQEIVRLSPREQILIRAGMLPIKAKRLRYFEEPHFTRLLVPPPEVPEIRVELRLDRRAPDPEPPPEAPKEKRKPERQPGRKPKAAPAPRHIRLEIPDSRARPEMGAGRTMAKDRRESTASRTGARASTRPGGSACRAAIAPGPAYRRRSESKSRSADSAMGKRART